MKVLIKRILPLFLIGILFFTCHKKTEAPKCGDFIENDLDPYLVNHFLFNAGSYWIYHDSVQNTNDSIYCNGKSFPHSEWSAPCGPGSGSGLISYTHGTSGNGYYIHKNMIVANNTNYTTFVPFALSNGSSLIQSNTVVLIPSCTIYGTNYSNVYRCFYKYPSEQSSMGWPDSVYFYFKQDVGLMRSEIYDSTQKKVRDIVSYHIQ
ncbi:MAG: hypothetical protein IAF38_12555 [Bacteroidia bacterium]|nr:hypothetical protein [Bacteroidia bacterium]